MKGPKLDQQLSHAFLYNESESTASPEPNGNGTELQSLIYQTIPLSKLPHEQAVALCNQLYSPEERFAKGFYRYWRDILKMPEETAWEATLNELNTYVKRLTDNLDDPDYHTVGFTQQGHYTPVGLYGFRSLQAHAAGRTLYDNMQNNHLLERYSGNLAIAHSFSALNGYRNRALMKFVFLMIALEAVASDFEHIFFFMSDYRLGPIYRRFGLEFPPDLGFQDSKHLVGCYSITPENLRAIKETADQFNHCILPDSLAKLETLL